MFPSTVLSLSVSLSPLGFSLSILPPAFDGLKVQI